MESMESFLCSFAYSAPDTSMSGMGMSGGMGMGMERAAPFLMYTHTLASKARHTPPEGDDDAEAEEWSIADLLVSGALDRPSMPLGKERELGPPRAWITSANDFVFVPSSRPTSFDSITAPQPSAGAMTRERRRTSDGSSGSGHGMLTPPDSVNLNHSSGLAGASVQPPTPVWQQHSRTSPLFREEPIVGTDLKEKEKQALPPTPPDSESDSSGNGEQEQVKVKAKRMSLAVPIFGGASKAGSVKSKSSAASSSSRWRFWKGSGLTAASA